MIDTFKELGGVLAEFEGRISYLEALHTSGDSSFRDSEEIKPEPTQIKERFVPNSAVVELKSMFHDLQNRINKHIDASKKRKPSY